MSTSAKKEHQRRQLSVFLSVCLLHWMFRVQTWININHQRHQTGKQTSVRRTMMVTSQKIIFSLWVIGRLLHHRPSTLVLDAGPLLLKGSLGLLKQRQENCSMASNNSSISTLAATASAAAAIASCYLLLDRSTSTKETTASDPAVPPSIPAPLLSAPYVQELELAIRLAHQAGCNMKDYLHAKGTVDESSQDVLGIETKSNSVDFCTKVDVENEQFIMKEIQANFPTHDIIGEETVGTGPIPPLQTNTPTWIIDPIDGTTNFSQGLCLTCVSIGYCVNGRPVMGVVYAPATDEWYVAVSGYGAFRNGVQIRQQTPKKSLETAVVCCEFGYSRKQQEIDAMLGAVSKILQHGCRAIRQLGSGVLDLCYVATGRLDIVYSGIVNEGWKPWDYAAALVICQEAGCVMETITQKPKEEFDLYGKSIICGVSRELVDDLRAVLMFAPDESGINWRPL